LVNVPASLNVVQGIDHQVKFLHKLESKTVFLNLTKVSFDLDVWVLLLNLTLESEGLRLVDMFSSKQELAIQVADIDCVEINDGYVSEATQ